MTLLPIGDRSEGVLLGDSTLSIVGSNQQFSPFEQLKHYDSSLNEYWLARELQPLLGYKQWRQFC